MKNIKIKKIIKFGLAVSVFGFAALIPLSAGAVTDDPVTDPNFQLAPSDCGQVVNGVLKECGWDNFLKLINRIIKFIIYISASLATLSFAYAGFMYLTAFGEMGKIEEAHNIFKTTITGMIIILLAWLLVATLLKVLEVGPDFTILDIGNVQTIK